MSQQPSESVSVVPSSDASPATAQGLRVLLVDDDHAIRVALGYVMSHAGLSVQEAHDGQEALSLLGKNPVDVVVMDLEMPVMDGVRALAMMRKNPALRQLPVVVLTNHASRDNVGRCVKLGAKGFMVKQDLDLDKLMQKLREVVDESSNASQGRDPSQGSGNATDQADGSAADAATSAQAAPPAPSIDLQTWRAEAQAIGRLERAQLQQILDETPLPVLNASVQHELIQQTQAGAPVEDLVTLVEQEPGLLLAYLSHANRAQANVRAPAMDAETALRWLGQASVGKVIDEVPESDAVPTASQLWVKRWWRHAIAVSQICNEIAQVTDIDPGLARTAGMIHDVGRLAVLCSEEHERAIKVLEAAPSLLIQNNHAEQALWGTHHKQAGSHICASLSLPGKLGEVCENHELEDSQRHRHDGDSGKLAAMVAAADQLAKASGFNTTANDEITPLPASMMALFKEKTPDIERGLAEAQTICLWRQGRSVSELEFPAVDLDGALLVFVGDLAGGWNPYHRLLTMHHARVTAYGEIRDVLDAKPMHDLMIMDFTTRNFSLALPMIRRVSQEKAFADIPKLILAKRSDDPENHLNQCDIAMNVATTPIRGQALVSTVKRLA